MQVLVGNRVTQIQPDRYFTTTTIWSLRQQALVAECAGWVVIADFATGKPADLTKTGGPYNRLHAFIADKAEKAACEMAQRDKERTKRDSSKL